MQIIATVVFAMAVIHTFAAGQFNRLSEKFRPGSVGENFFHFLGEVEVVFGLWAAVLITIWSFKSGTSSAAHYLESVDFTEAVFVFVIMCMSATKPILGFSRSAITKIAEILPLPSWLSLYVTILILGPLLGSLITEPAAMTVTAFLLKENFLDKPFSVKFKYATLGLLFVSVSIGGTLTHFAAPPVLMVAKTWGWDTKFMLMNFGPKVIPVILISTIATALAFRHELWKAGTITEGWKSKQVASSSPLWLVLSHAFFIFMTVLHSHHMSFFVPLFLLFLGWCAVTKEHQEELRIRESLLVGFFLGGLVTLGKLQDWWIQPIISSLEPTALYFGAIGLTAFTDNAALTYLGSLVQNLSDAAKYALVSGAVVGGGLTVIANAPNPAGFSILRDSFGHEGISPLKLLLGALPYTLLAAIFFLWL